MRTKICNTGFRVFSKELKMGISIKSFNDLDDTVNNRGFVHPLSEISLAFIEFAKNAPGSALDIGAATGVATIPLLENGIKTIAFDLEKQHLDILYNSTPDPYKKNLHTMVGHYPMDINLEKKSVGAVLISQVLGFLSGDEIREGFKKLNVCMNHGAKVFIINYTPYMSITASFVPVYEKRRRTKEAWPGLVQNISKYCTDKELLHNLPNTLNLLDPMILTRELVNAGFSIENSYFLGGMDVPEKFRLDGREWVGAIASKI